MADATARIDPLLTDELHHFSESEGLAVLATDYPISLKKRIHIAYDPVEGDHLVVNTVAEALDLLRTRGHQRAILVSQLADDETRIYGAITF